MKYSKLICVLATVLVMIASSPSQAQGPCTTPGWFGSNCQYKCHCAVGTTCSTNGTCYGGKCEDGWFGPACQYADLMKNSTMTASYSWLKDDDINTCNQNPSDQPITVTLSTYFPFTWLRLAVNTPDSFGDITVTFNDNKNCRNQRKAVVDSNSQDIHCDVDGLVNKVTLTGAGVSNLCSLYISGGRNVALKQDAIQETTYSPHNAPRAVDGNTAQRLADYSCTHTKNERGTAADAKWSVGFSHPNLINRYVLYNRVESKTVDDTDGTIYTCCQVRLQGFILEGYDQSGAVAFTYTDTTTTTQDVYRLTAGPSIPISPVLSSVNISATKYVFGGVVLTLCEVELYGDTSCPAGTFGRECERSCNCADENQACFVSTGGCPSGCAPGYEGEDCSQQCLPKFHGINCKDNCSINCENQLCSATTGVCLSCPAGKKGDHCEQNCEPTKYGRNCSQSCSQDCLDSKCNATNGQCITCPPGRIGLHCENVCGRTFYGDGCLLNCSTSCQNRLCNATNGYCDSCSVGMTGQRCEKECPHGTYGFGCKTGCSPLCGGNGSCHHQDGHCLQGCQDGYTGQMCGKQCENRKYGKDCNEDCSQFCNTTEVARTESPCDFRNGTCFYGCVESYKAPFCTVKMDAASNNGGGEPPVPLGAIIGATVAAVVVIVVVVVAVHLFRRRAASKGRSSNGPFSSTYVNAGIIPRSTENSNSAMLEHNATESPRLASPGTQISAAETATVAEVTAAHSQLTTAKKPDVKSKPNTPARPEAPVTSKGKHATYYNILKDTDPSKVVPVNELDTFIASRNKDFFQKQFEDLPTNEGATTLIGMSDKNRAKNRYKNICAYDHSRVHLEISESKKHGDYINASYIEGYKDEEKFIASQGPTKLILEDFIRMMWEQRVEKVVMLTNLVEEGKEKCERYWPEDDHMQVGEIKVTLTTTEVFADYTIRRLQLSKTTGEPIRNLTQFHFTSWPDKGVPTLAWGLVDFEQRVASIPTKRPIVVHCSAGVGRTGTFIALRNVMKEAEDTGQIDFFTTVAKLRRDRINMVQTAEQYEFLHRAAQVAIACMGTTVTSGDIRQRIEVLEQASSSGQSNMEKEFKAICNICDDGDESGNEDDDTGDNAENVYQNSRSASNKLKNRLSNILPKEYYRPKLFRENDDMGDYINAVLVPSFQQHDHHVLTQLPLPTTVTDFWRLVFQRRTSLIVACESDLQTTDSTIGDYLPKNEDEVLPAAMYNVKAQPPSPMEFGERQKVTVSADAEQKTRKSSIMGLKGDIRLTHFKVTNEHLHKPDTLLSVMKEIRSANSGGKGRTVFMCRNGADFSGLICVLSLLLDRMDHDQRLTVPLVVGAIKSIRPQVIPTLAQYKLLYQALQLYNDNTNVYSNFDFAATASNIDEASTEPSVYANTSS